MNKAYEQLKNLDIISEDLESIESLIRRADYFNDTYNNLFNEINETMIDIEDFLDLINEEIEPTIEEVARKI